MSKDITVVKVEPRGPGWRVTFSAPVALNLGRHRLYANALDAEDPKRPGNWLETDALGAYMWGLWVISKQEEWRNASNPG